VVCGFSGGSELLAQNRKLTDRWHKADAQKKATRRSPFFAAMNF